MKPATTPNPLKLNSSVPQFVLVIASLLSPLFLSAQNLLTNSSFTQGSTGWTSSCSVEVYEETVYGGTRASNKVTEIDNQRCLDQNVPILTGVTYKLSFKASRRIDASTPAAPGIVITVKGDNANTVYVNQTKSYSNSSFGWTNQSYTFTIPANSSDRNVNIHIADNNNHSTYGVVLDDIELEAISVLPVTFTSFSGVIKDNKAALSWLTGHETNNSYFIVERSVNGSKFDSVGRVQAGSSTANSYSFTENNANAISYYRLKQVDISGSYMYSTVITLKNSGNSREMTVYPTTATSTIQYVVSADAQATATITVYTITGQPVISQKEVLTQGLNIRSMNVGRLAAGAYFLKLEMPVTGVTSVKRFSKM